MQAFFIQCGIIIYTVYNGPYPILPGQEFSCELEQTDKT